MVFTEGDMSTGRALLFGVAVVCGAVAMALCGCVDWEWADDGYETPITSSTTDDGPYEGELDGYGNVITYDPYGETGEDVYGLDGTYGDVGDGSGVVTVQSF